MLIKILGLIIGLRRRELNLTLEDLSKITDISISELSRLENGKIKAPKSVILYRLANVLKLDYNTLLKYKYASYYREKELNYVGCYL